MTFYLIGPFYPFRGGIAQYLAVLGKKLEEKGHRVKVLSFRKQFPRFLFPGQTQIETRAEHIRLDAQALFVPWNPLSWWRTFRAILAGGPDAIIFKYWMPFFAPGFAAICALTKRYTDARTIFILDNVIPHERRPGDRFLTRLALRWVDCFIVQSEVVRRDLLKWFPEAQQRSVAQIAHPLYDCYPDTLLTRESSRQKLGLKVEGQVLLFFGLVRRYKGLDILIQALPQIVANLGDQVHLVIAGEFYEPEADYRRMIQEVGISAHVSLINHYIANEDVAPYFRAADLLVLPYRSATQSGVIQIAHYFGVPVISTTVGGIPEVIRDGESGFLVEPENPQRLADAVIRFFHHENGAAIRQGMKAASQRYSWEGLVKAVEDLAG